MTKKPANKPKRKPSLPLGREFRLIAEARKRAASVLLNPIGKRPKEPVDPKKAIVSHRGDIIRSPTLDDLNQADARTSVIEPVPVRPGTLWEMSHLFPRKEGQTIQSHVQTPRELRLHAQFVLPRGAKTPVLHHLHLSRAGTKPETHVERFVLGAERQIGKAPWVQAHPMVITPQGKLEVDTHNFVLIRGKRRELERQLLQALPKEPSKPTLMQLFRAKAYRVLGLKPPKKSR